MAKHFVSDTGGDVRTVIKHLTARNLKTWKTETLCEVGGHFAQPRGQLLP